MFLIFSLSISLGASPSSAADAPAPAHGWQSFFTDDLKNSGHWSEPDTSDTPNVGKVRGPFGSQSVTLKLDHLPEHKWVRVRFNLLIRGSWDGSNLVFGPDLWSLQVRGAQRLIFASICNRGNWSDEDAQSYPDDFSMCSTYPARTGAGPGAEKLNNMESHRAGLYTTYPVDVLFPNTDGTVRLDFAGIYDDPEIEQAWAISQVTVEVSSDVPTPDAADLPGLWDDLASADAVKADQAMWKFVGAGDGGILFLQDKLTGLKNKTEPSPKEARGMDQMLKALRLRRAAQVARIVLGPTSGSLFSGLLEYVPEY